MMRRANDRLPIWLVVALVVAVVGATVTAQQGNAPAGQAPNAAPAAGPGGNAAANANAPAAEGEAGQPEMQTTTFLELMVKGGWFMIPIGLCSLLGLAIMFERLFALRQRVIIPPGFLNGLKALFRHDGHDMEPALEYCRRNPSPVSRVVAVGIRKLPQGIESVEQAIEDAGANEVMRLRKHLRLLYGIASVSPMLGLLGTVWGMIEAFQVASITGLGDPASFAGGIYVALVTTFAGLCVAIPALTFYFYCMGKIESIVSEINDVCEEFVEHYLPVAERAKAAPPAQARAVEQPAAQPSGMQPATA